MHEMTRVWQFQLGDPVKKAGVKVTSRGASVYEYSLDGHKVFSSFNMEQQGEIISDFYIICIVGDARSVWNHRNYTKSPEALTAVLESFLRSPMSRTHLPVWR